MAHGPCEDCKATHQCGVQCSSTKCFDDHCSCVAKKKEVAAGLYQCDNCQLLIQATAKSFENYYDNAIKWYNDFCNEHQTQLHEILQSNISETSIKESTYDIIQSFCDAKSNFSKDISMTLQLDTILSRKNAYLFVKAFETLKSIEL